MRRNPKEEIDDPRREILIRALSAGMFMGAGGIIQPVQAMGKIPKVLEPGKSIYDMRGKVSVNGKKANIKTQIGANDTVSTGRRFRNTFYVYKILLLKSISETANCSLHCIYPLNQAFFTDL